ncbi:hypothetical protein HUO13_12110 [Saccharopolyspora erythraea]|uniref:PspA/IM30 family protein n=1 Tax=Saccharopolyspora erythraea TaxID=1836 RepID=UPI001BA7B080|nr:hypothetical protein [Saccharopolyspora erythraea]QUH01457.1 hypothetical protein HUO13_12110 [Saccharopolyspora erythraea]
MSEINETPVESAGQTETTSGDERSPEFYERELERARKDAAKYRERAKTAAEEAETKLRQEFATREGELTARIEELTAQVGAAEVKVSETERAATKLRLAVENGVPADKIDVFTKRLVGDNADELAADAKSLAEFFGPASVQEDRSQGSGAVPLNSPTLLQMIERKLGSR